MCQALSKCQGHNDEQEKVPVLMALTFQLAVAGDGRENKKISDAEIATWKIKAK